MDIEKLMNLINDLIQQSIDYGREIEKYDGFIYNLKPLNILEDTAEKLAHELGLYSYKPNGSKYPIPQVSNIRPYEVAQ